MTQGSVQLDYQHEVMLPLQAVAARHTLEPLAVRLQELRSWLASDLADLEATLQLFSEQRASSSPANVNLLIPLLPLLPGTRVRSAAAHLLQRPGKRLRPLCVLLAARLGGQPLNSVLRALAVACELVHAATLLHDDVIDDSRERRGAPAARLLYGNSASILAGDHLLVQALQLVLGTGYSNLLASLLQVITGMVAAEALQLERRGRFAPSRELYMQVIRGKTAALFAWGLQAGGQVGALPTAAMAALAQIGEGLGMAFQLVDDVLDLTSSSSVLGKDALVDVREGKLTWPIIVAAERDSSLCEDLNAIAQESGRELSPQRVAALVAKISASGALEESRALARQMASQACAQLVHLPPGPAVEALAWVIESAVSRVA